MFYQLLFYKNLKVIAKISLLKENKRVRKEERNRQLELLQKKFIYSKKSKE